MCRLALLLCRLQDAGHYSYPRTIDDDHGTPFVNLFAAQVPEDALAFPPVEPSSAVAIAVAIIGAPHLEAED